MAQNVTGSGYIFRATCGSGPVDRWSSSSLTNHVSLPACQKRCVHTRPQTNSNPEGVWLKWRFIINDRLYREWSDVREAASNIRRLSTLNSPTGQQPFIMSPDRDRNVTVLRGHLSLTASPTYVASQPKSWLSEPPWSKHTHTRPIEPLIVRGSAAFIQPKGRPRMWPVPHLSHTHAQKGTNLGIVRRSPVPFFSSCWENHTSRSFSVPSKKCALLSFIMRQQPPNKYCQSLAGTCTTEEILAWSNIFYWGKVFESILVLIFQRFSLLQRTASAIAS